MQFPPGKVLYETSGWLSGLRFLGASRDLAFLEHPVRHDDAGHVLILAAGKSSTVPLGGDWGAISGLVWNPQTREIWVSAARAEGPRSRWAASRGGRWRAIQYAPGSLTLRDIGRDGRLLLVREERTLEMAGS